MYKPYVYVCIYTHRDIVLHTHNIHKHNMHHTLFVFVEFVGLSRFVCRQVPSIYVSYMYIHTYVHMHTYTHTLIICVHCT